MLTHIEISHGARLVSLEDRILVLEETVSLLRGQVEDLLEAREKEWERGDD